jgi:hypothetical protein
MLFALVAVVSGLGGFATSFPGWLSELDAGHPGCVFEAREGRVVVTGAAWEGSPCEAAVGAQVDAVDGVAVRPEQASDQASWEGEPSSAHRWTITRAGQTTDLTLTYEQGPLAQTLGEAGDARGDRLVVVFALAGAALRTWAFLVVVIPLLRARPIQPAALIVASTMVSAVLGLGFDGPHAGPTYRMWEEIAELCVGIGLATVLVVVPRGRENPIAATLIGLAWTLATAIAQRAAPGTLPDELVLRVDLAFAAGVVGLLLVRARSVPYRAWRDQLLALAGATGLLMLASIPLVFNILPPAIAELHADVLFPVASAPLSLAIAYAMVPADTWDVSRQVRTSVVVTFGGALVVLAVLAAAELGPRLARVVPDALAHQLPDGWLTMVVLAVMGLGAGRAIRLVAWAVDTLILPQEGKATVASTRARDALCDCGDEEGVAWCARALLRSGFGASGGRVLVRDGEAWREVGGESVIVPPDLAALAQQESLRLPNPEAPWSNDLYLAIRHEGGWLGVLHANARDTAGFSPWDEARLRETLPSFGLALWRATVSGDRVRPATETSAVRLKR